MGTIGEISPWIGIIGYCAFPMVDKGYDRAFDHIIECAVRQDAHCVLPILPRPHLDLLLNQVNQHSLGGFDTARAFPVSLKTLDQGCRGSFSDYGLCAPARNRESVRPDSGPRSDS